MYEIGALAALDDFLSGGLNDFNIYVGTSAGSFLATVLAAGIRARRLFRAALDDDPNFFPVRRTDIYRFDVRQGLGILRDVGGVLLSAAARAARGKLNLAEVVTDFGDALPAGIFSLRHYERFLERFLRHHSLPTRFAEVPRELYITANDLDSGHRAIFGQGALVDIPIAKAICASSAIPLFFEPVRWQGRDYIDGAVGKVAHADIALARKADLIIVVNPQVPVHNDPDREGLPTPLVGAHHLRDKGMLAVWAQAGKMSTRTKLFRAFAATRRRTRRRRSCSSSRAPRSPRSSCRTRWPSRRGAASCATATSRRRASSPPSGRAGRRCSPASTCASIARRLQPPWELTA